jgi:hypothetical protein
MLSSTEGLVESGTADAPGEMSLTVNGKWMKRPEWLKGVTDFLIVGLRDLQAEFPREISVRIL